MLALACFEAARKVRRCEDGAVNWRVMGERKARLKLREAMLGPLGRLQRIEARCCKNSCQLSQAMERSALGYGKYFCKADH